MGSVVAAAPSPFLWGVSGGACIVAFALGLLIQAARAEDSSPELIQPAVCSPVKPIPPELKGICEVTKLAGTRHKVKVNLTATTVVINVGGYAVETENYNGAYLSPVIEAIPGDTVAAHLENWLKGNPLLPGATINHLTMAEGSAGENPTNLHYFHGGIVTPNNARPPIDASQGNGDNIYVRLKNREAGKPNSFDYNVPIPGEKELDARVLEGAGLIAHPNGLDWYHSHMHGISSDQVMGGLAGLLSVGEDKASVRAKCAQVPPDPAKCDEDTEDLKKRTIVRYALLQEISLDEISALPGDAAQHKTAHWAPRKRGYIESCDVWNGSQWNSDPKLRKGFCQPNKDEKSALLFTLNGQRFPTITVGDNQNLLLRIGNLSANVTHWLELCKENTPCKTGQTPAQTLPLTILSLDGVVPAKPIDPRHAGIPVDAFDVNDLLFMSASRAEIYVRNDTPHSNEQVYFLRTKGLDVGSDLWPEIQLARVVLKPTKAVSGIALALNAPIEQIRPSLFAVPKQKVLLPEGCVRDLEEGEHRRVTFTEGPDNPAGETTWSIGTEIMHPKSPGVPGDERLDFVPVESETIGTYSGSPSPPNPLGRLKGIGFEEYVNVDHSIDWVGERHKHACIRLDHKSSHKQLWVLYNPTSGLHNFHIHQIKFRLATRNELENKYHIKPPTPSHTCEGIPPPCPQPDYKLYEEDLTGTAESHPVWHDTIPIPNDDKKPVFLVMSFDAKQQIGRFVYHCHILKHEDNGLMAPIEVWDPLATRVDR